MQGIDNIRRFILDWNNRFPVDKWWRDKHEIAFNSTAHRESNFLDQLIEFEEDKMYREANRDYDYEPGKGEFFRFFEGEKTFENQADNAKNEFEEMKKMFLGEK